MNEHAANGRSAMSLIGGIELPRSVSDLEKQLREEMAAAFKVGFYLGWNIDTLNHITLRIPGTDTILMNPRGFAWHEITPDALVTVDFEGRILSHSGVKVAVAGFNFHSGILKARPDLNSVIHTHASPGLVLSTLEEPLQILDQGGCLLHDEVSYHPFEGFVDREDEVPRILSDLGHRHALIMQNHGLLSVGATLGEAFCYMRMLVDASALYERAMATGRPIRSVPDDVQRSTKARLGSKSNAPLHDESWSYFLRLAKQLDNSPR